MAEDIAPKLLSSVEKAFKSGLKSKGISDVKAVKALAAENKLKLHDYSQKVGDALANAYAEVLTPDAMPDGTLYYNIANKVMRPTITEAHGLVSDVADAGQAARNKKIGIGLKPIRPPIEEDRLAGIIDAVTSGVLEDTATYLNEPVKNIVDHFADRHLEKNAEFLTKSGVPTQIIRTANNGCCKWCTEKSGTYENYEQAESNEAFSRHEGCRCTLEIVSSRGSGFMNTSGHAFVRTT